MMLVIRVKHTVLKSLKVVAELRRELMFRGQSDMAPGSIRNNGVFCVADRLPRHWKYLYIITAISSLEIYSRGLNRSGFASIIPMLAAQAIAFPYHSSIGTSSNGDFL